MKALQPLTPHGVFLWYSTCSLGNRTGLHDMAALKVLIQRFLASDVLNKKGVIQHRTFESDPAAHSMLAMSVTCNSSLQAYSYFSS